jgi:hypothetical protein
MARSIACDTDRTESADPRSASIATSSVTSPERSISTMPVFSQWPPSVMYRYGSEKSWRPRNSLTRYPSLVFGYRVWPTDPSASSAST